jgi:hypothetical protein
MKAKDKVKNGGVLIIPKDTLKCDAYRELPPRAKLVFIAMMTEWWRSKDDNPKNEVKVSQYTIKYLTGLSIPTIWRGIGDLKAAKFVEVKPEHQGGLERNTNIYTLNGKYLF